MDITELFPWLIGAGTFATVLFTILVILCTTVPFVLIFGGIGYYIYKRSKDASQARQAALSWRQTNGVIVKSRVEVTGGDHSSVNPHIVYEYEVNGQRYEGQQVRAGDRILSVMTSRQAYDFVDKYPAGAQVMVFYNPDNPVDSALER